LDTRQGAYNYANTSVSGDLICAIGMQGTLLRAGFDFFQSRSQKKKK